MTVPAAPERGGRAVVSESAVVTNPDGSAELRDSALLRDVGALLSQAAPDRATLETLCRRLLACFGGIGAFVAFVEDSGTIRLQCLWEDGKSVLLANAVSPPQTNSTRVATTEGGAASPAVPDRF